MIEIKRFNGLPPIVLEKVSDGVYKIISEEFTRYGNWTNYLQENANVKK